MSRNDDGNLLKRRLLGAAVLIALAVIFLPLLLDGSGSESRFRRVEQLRVEPPRIIDSQGRVELPTKPVPKDVVKVEKPVIAPVEIVPEPKPAPVAATGEKAATEASVEAPKATPAPIEPAPVKTDPAPAIKAPVTSEITDSVAWIVQAGSFSDEANARSVRDQLRQSGFPAFISEGTGNSGSLYRVKVGPITDRAQAEKVQKRVQIQLGQPTIIKQYR